MNRRLLASPTHTAVVLAIVGVVTALAIQTAASASSSSASSSRIAPYLVLIALQLLWVRYIHVGLKAKRHALSTLTGARWTAHTFLLDLAFGAVGFFAARIVAESVKAALGGGEANTAFLLPQGVAESALWVLVSCTASTRAGCPQIPTRPGRSA